MIRPVLAVLVLCCVLAGISATSDADPAYVYNCDAHSSLWGCNPGGWAGSRLYCLNKTRLMYWATSPQPSPCYVLSAGDEKSPSTRYTPDTLIQINLRVTCYEMQFRGLMLYATSARTGARVGNWSLAHEDPALFKLPWDGQPNHACARTVMHASGVIKPYFVSLHFRAPPVGTGTITFKTLIKIGDANTGDFFWPERELTLTEGAQPTFNSNYYWTRSAQGQSCSRACAARGMGCDDNAWTTINSPANLLAKIGGNFTCKQPILSACGTRGGSMSASDEYCMFADTTCASQNRPVSAVRCNIALADSYRFCPCSSSIAISTEPDVQSTTGLPDDYYAGTTGRKPRSTTTGVENVEPTDEEAISAALHQRNSISLTVALFPFLFAVMTGKTTSVLAALLLLAAVVSPAQGHNWIHSYSRSVTASTLAPCKVALTEIPHVQVGPGQTFSIEWMTGHGFPAYFAIVHSKNAKKLKLNTVEVLEDYIKSAPVGTTNTAQQPQWQKYHWKFTSDTTNDDRGASGPDIPDYFEKLILPSDPLYIGRAVPINITEKIPTTQYQMKFKPSELDKDVRISYRNAKYPWLEAVYKFTVETVAATRFDTARFVIPGFEGPGRYIVQYSWRGYYDCTDVDLKAAVVPKNMVYGYKPSAAVWARIDHCLFKEPTQIYDLTEIVTDAQYCLESCKRNGDCQGVAVVPMQAPSSVYRFPQQPNWLYPSVYGSDLYVPWNHSSFENPQRVALKEARKQLTESMLKNPSPNRYMCYTLLPRLASDTEDEYTVTSDPEDPLFYSTCFFQITTAMFDDYVDSYAPVKTDVPWRYHHKCIGCQQQAENTWVAAFPRWSTSDVCIDCDGEPVTTSPPVPFKEPTLVEANAACDGAGSNGVWMNAAHHSCGADANCTKLLQPVGRATSKSGMQAILPSECALLASQDPECSNYIVMPTPGRYTVTPACQCYLKKECCKTCSRSTGNNYRIMEVSAAAPDPTCTSGVKSTDGKSCCTADCGEGGCSASTATNAKVGFCCPTCIKNRPCSSFGPPCNL